MHGKMCLERCNDHDKAKEFLELESLLEPQQLGFNAHTHTSFIMSCLDVPLVKNIKGTKDCVFFSNDTGQGLW